MICWEYSKMFNTDFEFLTNRGPHFLPLFGFNLEKNIITFNPYFQFAGTNGYKLTKILPIVLSMEIIRAPQGFVNRCESATSIFEFKSKL